MAQPFQIYGSQGGGRSFGRRPIVLARLPRVGAVVRTVEIPRVETQPTTFAQATRFYLDPQHAAASLRQVASLEQESEERPTSHRRHHGSHQRPRVEARPQARLHQPDTSVPLPARVASYSGLLMTLVMAGSVAMMYWMIIIPRQTPGADIVHSNNTLGSNEIELPQFDFPSPPVSQPMAAPPVATFDPFVTQPIAEKAETPVPAPPVAEAEPVPTTPTMTVIATPPTEAQAPVESVTPTDQPSVELTPLPEVIPAPEITPQVIYNDASACVYPITDHPLASDATVLGRVDASLNDGAVFFPVPQVARQTDGTMIR